MQFIFNFILYRKSFFLFLILEMLCFYWLFTNEGYQQSVFLNSANGIVGAASASTQQIKTYFYLKEENESLLLALAKSKTQQVGSFRLDTPRWYKVGDSSTQRYLYTVAQVVNSTTNFKNNYITLNKGSADGIKPLSAVVNQSGVVGVVKDVSKHFSTVLSVINRNSTIPAKIEKSNYTGTLVWDGVDYRFATLSEVPSEVKLKKGDRIVSNEYSAIFPSDVAIGTVESSSVVSGSSMQAVKIRLSVNFKQLSNVFIVLDLEKSERDSLENKMNSLLNN